MKKLLLITSAVGLCLAAPAFAQTSTQPAPETKATQSQTTQPTSSQSQKQQPAPSAQAPASDQKPASSAQAPASNQKPASSAQAPAGSSQPSSSAQAPAAPDQKPASSAQAPAPSSKQSPASAQAPAQQSGTNRTAQQPTREQQRAQQRQERQEQRAQQRQNRDEQRASNRDTRQEQRAQRDAQSSNRASVSVNLNDTQRTRIAATLTNGNLRRVDVNFRVAAGVVVPSRVALAPLPASIIEIVPQYRGYSYFVTHDEIVIVQPRTKKIVTVLPAGGTARAQSSSSRVNITEQQRDTIRSRSSSLRSRTTTGSSARILIEQEVPEAIELEEFPAEIVTEVPVVRSYRYITQGDEILVVEPTQRRVIEVIR